MTGDAVDEERIPDPRPQPTPLWALLSRWLLALEAWLRSHGGPRLRGALWAFWGVVALAGGILLFGPVINPPLTLDDITDSASKATDTWIARDFDVDYTLSRDAEGRLQADVVETIDAFFPDDVEAYGIVRVLPTQYEGHALAPSHIEATVDGRTAQTNPSESADQLTLTLQSRDPDDTGSGATRAARVEGDHEYVIRYRLHDLAYSTTDQAAGDGPVDLLAWDVFGPSWPQAFAGLDVSITLPSDLDDALVRQPRGSLAWTLLSAGDWLEPEADSPPGQVTYSFTNDQNIPPHASARFTMVFEPGTFRMPPPTPLFLLQSFGPLLPLAFLVLTLLFALAARAVAWSDERGRPWFVARFEPPDGVSPRMAAMVLRAPEALELATALSAIDARKAGKAGKAAKSAKAGKPATANRNDRLHAAARSAHRTGRLGDRIRALLAYRRAPERSAQLTDGLRRIPTGFVRDLFIAAPLALTLLQWGLVRQLSHQATLAVVWWPAAFVLMSSLISIVVLAIALSARPLTRAGALVKQHLMGISAYVSRTSFLERATVDDPLLPYAVLTVEPRSAGSRTLALLETTLGDAQASRGWRTRDFLSTPRILVRIVAVALFAAAVTTAAVLPNPYPRSPDYSANSGDLPGTYWNKVDSFDSAATLTVDDDRHASLAVTEHLTIDFGTESSSEVPQFARQWLTQLDGQDLGLRVTSVRLDGSDARYGTVREGDSVLLMTAFAQVLSGVHDLDIGYTVSSPVVAAASSGASAGSGTVDRLRWVSLLEGWDDASAWRDDPAPDPLRVSITVPSELTESAIAAGWITLDTESSDSVRQWEDSVVPFGSYPAAPAADDSGTTDTIADDSGTADTIAAADGTTTYRLDLREAGNGYPFDLTVDDVGAQFDFPAGTFAGPDPSALTAHTIRSAFPLALVVALGFLTLALGILSAAAALRRRSRRAPPGFFRDVIWWLGTAAALSTVWLFVWSTSDMPDDWPEFPPLGLAALAALVGAALCLTVTLRSAPPVTKVTSGTGG
ncbi:DUF2207 domain-containing protein [Herbiconiux sp. P16]|uniref:DUF2207 domain-containing protein n=1 Tax=Herbiconiux wuyangfengii TaxID=3342794 RepID=UPI0035B9CDA9